jgi:hypothetical protein
MSATERQILAPFDLSSLDLSSFRERIPALAWSALLHCFLDFFNRRFLGLPQARLYGSITSQL